MNFRHLIYAAGVLSLVMMVVALVFFGGQAQVFAHVDRIVATCSQEGDRNACYEREVPALYPEYSIPELFDIVREIRAKDPRYQFCHVLAHKLGEAVVAEDPNNWLNAIPLNPGDGICSNGFIHGVVGGRFRAEVLDETTLTSLYSDFRQACEPHAGWQPSPLDQAICYHGMGHLYVFITDADLRRALEVCEATADPAGLPDNRQVCREGVFMQIYQPLEPDDFLMIERMTVKPTKETVREFCAAYDDVPEYEGACLRESWPFFREEITTGTGVEAFCSGQPNVAEERNCYQSATAIIGRMSLDDSDKAARACNAIPEVWQALCFTAVATAVVEEDRGRGEKAVALCQKANDAVANECLTTIASRASWIYGSNREGMQKFCAALPTKYQAVCR